MASTHSTLIATIPLLLQWSLIEKREYVAYSISFLIE